MEPIRYLPLTDLAVPVYIENANILLSQIAKKGFSLDINDVVSIFNILRYLDDGLEKQLNYPDRESLKSMIVEFCQSHGHNHILNFFSQLSRWIENDFWRFFVSFGLEKKLKEEDFNTFLSHQQPNIHPILIQKSLHQKFRQSLREYFLSNVKNVHYFIDEKDKQYLPPDITPQDKLSLISAYIDSDSPSLKYLEILAKFKDIPPRMRLVVQKRAKDVTSQVLSSSNTFKFGIEVSYTEQTEAVHIELEDNVAKYSYNLNWFRLNSDNATLLNNFIHLFDYVDEQGRLTLCFQMSEQGVFERTITTQRADWYPESIAFRQKNDTALIQLQSYSNLLNSFDTSVEKLINWFFRDYLRNEFEISDFQSDIPEGERPFIEKCKLLASEFERILRQFQLYVEDGHIDHDLIAIETNPFPLSDTGSFLKQKYCYLQSEDGERAIYYFYSDQCMFSYDSKAEKSYETFANRLAQMNLGKDDFEEYQKPDLDWLIQQGYLRFEEEDLVIANVHKIILLGEIYRNGCLCYNTYQGVRKDALDAMIENGTLQLKSSLFSESEAAYIDYHLNKRKYINSLDLRNKYTHGSYFGAEIGDREHELNYFQMLKIMICIVLKINDELCRKSELISMGTSCDVKKDQI